MARKRFQHSDRKSPKSSGNFASFAEAQTLEEAISSARRINSRTRRDKMEFKEARKSTRLAALLPRWCPDESAGE